MTALSRLILPPIGTRGKAEYIMTSSILVCGISPALSGIIERLGEKRNIKVYFFKDFEQLLKSGGMSISGGILFYDVISDNSENASVLNEVKTIFPGIRIVPVSDSTGKDKLEWAIRRGAVDFIEKPCTPDEIENILDLLERDC